MILKLTPSRNKKNFYRIYIEDEFLGAIPQKLIPPDYFLQTETEISDEFICYVKDWVRDNASAILLGYLSKMERTVNDCKVYLRKWDVPESVIALAIEEAKSKKWVSDERYADLYTEDAILFERSPLDTKHKLLQKKIAPEIVNRIISKSFNNETKEEIIGNLIEKMLPRYAGLNPDKQFEKIATALYRKGFEYNDYEELLHSKISDKY